jgi:hypothetical protein
MSIHCYTYSYIFIQNCFLTIRSPPFAYLATFLSSFIFIQSVGLNKTGWAEQAPSSEDDTDAVFESPRGKRVVYEWTSSINISSLQDASTAQKVNPIGELD